ncbi:hypothetical protein SAMN05444008_10142 [Cnuella takakiae]|uniref:Tetratricopeptide repeat-containing protein n=2 Tax=Cnuella takakiae TaxID=1302690 RepID=A0A1M4SA81_9BACT|nr:hypothetical protein BUE76_23075 [Cnuella takakiae]SHE29055.1 hypothetical protein SAMN05444008_10142 [Cnuella takakiae]
MAEKWEEAKRHKSSRIVRLLCAQDELDMVDAFYTFMIGVDTPIFDIAFLFDSRCYDLRDYSFALVAELQEIVDIWNRSVKDERIDDVPVHWQADFSLAKDENPAALFIDNFNKLANALALPDGLFVVAVLRGGVVDFEFTKWLSKTLELPINAKVKILIHDSIVDPAYEGIAIDFEGLITSIPLYLDMPKAMEQAAAMGDPNDPGTQYRKAFVKMMNAMGAAKQQEAETCGRACIDIATSSITKDPYWVMQLVVVNIALGNDKIRYKQWHEALSYADEALAAAQAAQQYFANNMAGVLIAQAQMFRGSVYFLQKEWSSGWNDYSAAYELFIREGNMPLAIESCRMAGQCAFKEGLRNEGLSLLAKGVRLGFELSTEVAKGSTYAALLHLLLSSSYQQYISLDEVDAIAGRIYGPNWLTAIRNYRQVPGPQPAAATEPVDT